MQVKMMAQIELETTDLDEDKLTDWASRFDTCNGFAFWYQENVNQNAIVKDGLAFGTDEHCYVYDPELDVTIDATCGQFDDAPYAAAWDGDFNRFVDEEGYDHEEVYEWTSRDEFETHYSQHMNSPFIF